MEGVTLSGMKQKTRQILLSMEWALKKQKPTKTTRPETNDELRPEFDLRSLRVRKLGAARKSFGDTVGLDPDVANVFPDADRIIANVGDESSC